MTTPAAVYLIAECPEHGLHGQREECFVCGKPVRQVRMVLASEAERLAAALEASLKPEPDEGEGLGGVGLSADAVAEEGTDGDGSAGTLLAFSPSRADLIRWAEPTGEHGEWMRLPTSAWEGLLWVLAQVEKLPAEPASATSPAHRRGAPEPCSCWPDQGDVDCPLHGMDAPAGRPVPPLNPPLAEPEQGGTTQRQRVGSRTRSARDTAMTAPSPGSASGDEATIREALNAVMIVDRASALWPRANAALAASVRLGERARRAESLVATADAVARSAGEPTVVVIEAFDAFLASIRDQGRGAFKAAAREVMVGVKRIDAVPLEAALDTFDRYLDHVEGWALARLTCATSDRAQAVAPEGTLHVPSESESVAGLRAALAAAEAERDELRAVREPTAITVFRQDRNTALERLAVTETALRELAFEIEQAGNPDAIVVPARVWSAMIVARRLLAAGSTGKQE